MAKFRASTVLGFILAVFVAAPASVLVAVYRSEEVDPAPPPDDYSDGTITVPEVHSSILKASKKIGEGLFPGPEDLAYDAASEFLYTSCDDGWIRRIKLRKEGETAKKGVEKWAYVGGRPLGLAIGPNRQLLVASADKGLLSVNEGGEVHLLSDDAEGVRFGLTNGVDVASEGTIYFTDASYKYNHSIHMLDLVECRPHGRLLGFNPETGVAEVLLHGLYFPNGVAVSSDQRSVVFCESALRRCRRYHVHGQKRGAVEPFIDNLPGFPDNIKNDGDGHFWIGLFQAKTVGSDVFLRYSWLRKVAACLVKYVGDGPFRIGGGGGVLSVSSEGKPLALYVDKDLSQITTGIRVGGHLLYCSLLRSHIGLIPVDLSEAGSK